jgi:hypothetical protein
LTKTDRAKLDAALAAIEYSQQYKRYDTAVRIAVDRLNHIEKQNQQSAKVNEDNCGRILSVVQSLAADNTESHMKAQCAIVQVSTQCRGHSDEVILLVTGIVESLKTALEESRQQHVESTQLLRDSRQAATRQIEALTDEIRLLENQFEQTVKRFAASGGHLSRNEEEHMKSDLVLRIIIVSLALSAGGIHLDLPRPALDITNLDYLGPSRITHRRHGVHPRHDFESNTGPCEQMGANRARPEELGNT